MLGEYMQERYGILDALEVGWYLKPLAEFAPGGGVYLEDCGREDM